MKEALATLGVGGFMIVIILSVFAAIGAIVWPYTINTWLIFAGKAPIIVWWQGSIMGFVPVMGQIGIPVAFVTWVLMLFLI